MTGQELVEKLKADRRAELKAAEDALEARKREELERADRAFAAALPAALEELGAGMLAEFYAGANVRADYDRVAKFAIPGHALVELTFNRCGDRWTVVPYAAGLWIVRRQHYETLADALIAAEGKEHEEPIPF